MSGLRAELGMSVGMKTIDLSSMPNADLVREFEDCAIQQSYAEARGDLKPFKKLFAIEGAIVAELKVREQRLMLRALFEHENAWVRLKAAQSTLPVALDEAKRVLQALKDRKLQPEALHAGMSLANLERGWCPVPD